MIKKLKETKAFAMAEVLAVVVVILVIFSTVFSNYLSLVSSYETRMNYNNVTAQYASFYVRKLYKEALENPNSNIDKAIDTSIKEKGFYSVYNEKDKNFGLDNNSISKLNALIDEYKITDIIITNYDISSLKERVSRDNKFYNYIKYLPKYEQKEKGFIEPYRLMLKLENFGFSTTSILIEPDTKLDCFDMSYDVDLKGFVINNYYNNKKECSSNVSIVSSKLTIEENTGNVVKIGDNAFRNKGITSVKIPSSVKIIGSYAFSNNNISDIDFDSLNVTDFGKYAFSNNKLKEVKVKNTSYKEGVFSDNELSKITFDNVTTISNSMFKLTKPNKEKLELTIPKTVTSIEDSAFENLKFKSISFEDESRLKTIGNNSFSTSYDNNDNIIDLVIPSSVQKIGNNAFSNVNINSITFKNDNNSSLLETIGEGAFSQDKQREKALCQNDACKTITILPYVTNIGKEAFKNLGNTKLVFEEKEGNSYNLVIGDNAFIGNPFTNVTLSDHIKEGKTIFGNNPTFEEDSLVIKTNSLDVATKMFTDINWCNLLYGNNCNSSKINDQDKLVYKYSYNGKDIYISYISGGDSNE